MVDEGALQQVVGRLSGVRLPALALDAEVPASEHLHILPLTVLWPGVDWAEHLLMVALGVHEPLAEDIRLLELLLLELALQPLLLA